jgi:hypothetical protein
MVPMEPASLVMERRMLRGIKQRAERLHRQRAEPDSADGAQTTASHRDHAAVGKTRSFVVR